MYYAFKDGISITQEEIGPRFDLAVELLSKQRKFVVLEDAIAFYHNDDYIECEVITQHTSILTDKRMYVEEFERAKALFNTSTLSAALKGQKLRWCVVDVNGMGRYEVWRPET
jgi:hypothetical protein